MSLIYYKSEPVFLARNLNFFKHMSLWCMFVESHQTTYNSIIGDMKTK